MTADSTLDLIATLNEKIEKLQNNLDLLSNATLIEWEDTKTDSGIQLQGGPTTITRHGAIILRGRRVTETFPPR